MENMKPHETFATAIRSMAVSSKSIQERVVDAWVCHLIYLKSDELPTDIRYRFTELNRRLIAVKPNGSEGNVFATTNQMSIDEAIEIAQEIVSMADSI